MAVEFVRKTPPRYPFCWYRFWEKSLEKFNDCQGKASALEHSLFKSQENVHDKEEKYYTFSSFYEYVLLRVEIMHASDS